MGDANSNKKGLPQNVGSERKTKEDVDLLLNGAEDERM